MEEDEVDEETQDATDGVEVLPVSDELLGSVSVSINNSGPGAFKGKYYRQTYRTAWEQMPDFKGWLQGVQGEPTRAYCIYCQKTLHAHRLSLLKHTCTIRHQRAAQIHNIRKGNKNKEMDQLNQEMMVGSGGEEHEENDSSGLAGDSGEYKDQRTIVTINDMSELEQEGEQDEDIEEEEEAEGIPLESLPVQFQKQFQQQIVPMSSYSKPPISTHVLDTSRGSPVSGLQVSLYKLIEGRWTYINEGITSSDGRFSNFVERNHFTPGRYKLHYDVDRYFEARKQDTMYPFVEIVIDCRGSNEHYHVPLLISQFGYTTYRGT